MNYNDLKTQLDGAITQNTTGANTGQAVHDLLLAFLDNLPVEREGADSNVGNVKVHVVADALAVGYDSMVVNNNVNSDGYNAYSAVANVVGIDRVAVTMGVNGSGWDSRLTIDSNVFEGKWINSYLQNQSSLTSNPDNWLIRSYDSNNEAEGTVYVDAESVRMQYKDVDDDFGHSILIDQFGIAINKAQGTNAARGDMFKVISDSGAYIMQLGYNGVFDFFRVGHTNAAIGFFGVNPIQQLAEDDWIGGFSAGPSYTALEQAMLSEVATRLWTLESFMLQYGLMRYN